MDELLSPTSDLPPALTLRRLIASYRITHAIAAAAELGVADHLGETPRGAAELAALVGANPQALSRLLRALVSIGLVAEEEDGRFSLTPVGACLRSDAPSGMRDWALCEGAEYYQRAWMRLPQAVRTGETAFEHAHGLRFYQYFTRDAEAGQGFSRAMVDFARLIAEAVAAEYDVSGVRRVVDVGGNSGRLLLELLRAHPELSGVLFDRPAVIAGPASEAVRASGLGERCTLIAGDFFAAVPAGGDLYVLSRILMDYDDERCLQLLRNCRRAMSPQGRVLIVQLVMPPRGGDVPREQLFEPVISDLNMLVLTGGRERSEEEYRGLLEAAGFRLSRVLPSRALVSFLEARPAGA